MQPKVEALIVLLCCTIGCVKIVSKPLCLTSVTLRVSLTGISEHSMALLVLFDNKLVSSHMMCIMTVFAIGSVEKLCFRPTVCMWVYLVYGCLYLELVSMYLGSQDDYCFN